MSQGPSPRRLAYAILTADTDEEREKAKAKVPAGLAHWVEIYTSDLRYAEAISGLDPARGREGRAA